MDSGWGRRKGKGGYRHQGHQTKTGFPSPSSQKRFKMIIYWHLYNFDINFVSNVPLRSIIYYQLCILLLVCTAKNLLGLWKITPLVKALHATLKYSKSRCRNLQPKQAGFKYCEGGLKWRHWRVPYLTTSTLSNFTDQTIIVDTPAIVGPFDDASSLLSLCLEVTSNIT